MAELVITLNCVSYNNGLLTIIQFIEIGIILNKRYQFPSLSSLSISNFVSHAGEKTIELWLKKIYDVFM